MSRNTLSVLDRSSIIKSDSGMVTQAHLVFSYNLANLPSKVDGVGNNAGLTYSYGYLSDGTKTSADCGSGSGSTAQGLRYRGSFVYEILGGEVERLQSSGNRHRFGGKEEQRIGSTDLKLLDFGARYYDAFACRWTSIDPLAWKYPAITPYSYCAGNPVNLVDPAGMDEWEINKMGSIVKQLENTEHDIFFIVDDDGNRILKNDGSYLSISFDDNSFQSNDDISLLGVTGSNGFNACNEINGARLIKFLADNTSVEFGLITTDDISFVVTNHSFDKINVDAVAERLNNRGYRIGLIMHNHPNNSPPSGFEKEIQGKGDKAAACIMPLVEHYVYLPKFNSVISYDMFGCYCITQFDWLFNNY